jgi:8-oxo-dGTP diphosphatase
MGKSTRAPILAAGGIVIRNGPRPLIAVVQRRRDDAWVLPKGKLKANEKPIAAAKREAIEETGCDVRVHEFLGLISYVGGNGPKIAHFWRMQTTDAERRKLMGDIKAVEWLPLSGAIDRLSLPHEQFFLHNVGRHALKRMAQKTKARQLKRLHVDAIEQAVTAIPPDAVPVRRSKSRPRWEVLARLTRRLQAALGTTPQ